MTIQCPPDDDLAMMTVCGGGGGGLQLAGSRRLTGSLNGWDRANYSPSRQGRIKKQFG